MMHTSCLLSIEGATDSTCHGSVRIRRIDGWRKPWMDQGAMKGTMDRRASDGSGSFSSFN